jgi:hypothetical protein
MRGGKGEMEGLVVICDVGLCGLGRHSEMGHKKGAQRERGGMTDRYWIDGGTLSRSSRGHARQSSTGTSGDRATGIDARMNGGDAVIHIATNGDHAGKQKHETRLCFWAVREKVGGADNGDAEGDKRTTRRVQMEDRGNLETRSGPGQGQELVRPETQETRRT